MISRGILRRLENVGWKSIIILALLSNFDSFLVAFLETAKVDRCIFNNAYLQ